jgi:hypothetical protein
VDVDVDVDVDVSVGVAVGAVTGATGDSPLAGVQQHRQAQQAITARVFNRDAGRYRSPADG